MKRRWLAAVVLGMLTVATSTAFAQEEEKEEAPKRSRDVITADEIAERNDIQTAYDAIRRLRPAFLRVRGSRSGQSGSDALKFYIDNMAETDPDVLKSLPATAVLEIRRLSASEATFRYGGDHPQGAIVIKTRRPGMPPG